MKTNRIRLLLSFACLAVVLGLLPSPALAGCNRSYGARAGATVKLPAAQPNNGTGQGNKSNSIVGLWNVTYYFDDGTAWAQSFDQWFADGNEVEAADLGQGVLCQGTWKQTAPGTVKLFHVGWSYDFVNLNLLVGSFTEEQIDTVSADGSSYQGTYHFTFYDTDANNVGELTGTLRATRLAVN